MKHTHIKKALLVTASVGAAWAADGSIGAVNTTGRFVMNGVETVDRASLVDGATIENHWATSQLHLTNGARVILSQDAKAEVHGNRINLLQGSAEVSQAQNFEVHVRGMRVLPGSKQDTVLVALNGKSVQVGAMNGRASVLNSMGGAVGQVLSGTALMFQPAPQTPSTIQVTGKLTKEGNRFYLTDGTTKLRVEVQGNVSSEWIGKQVDLTGSVIKANPQPNVAYLISLDSIKKAAAVVTSSGESVGLASGLTAKTAVIGGVAVGAGTASAIVLKSEKPKPLSN